MQYGFKNFAEDVLNTVQKPLSIMEIWEEGIRLGLNKKLGSSGKTPWATLGARLYTDIKLNDQSNFKQISRRPALFALKSQIFAVSEVNKRQLESETVPVKCSYEERALHAVLAKYLETSSYFMCPVKPYIMKNLKRENCTRTNGHIPI